LLFLKYSSSIPSPQPAKTIALLLKTAGNRRHPAQAAEFAGLTNQSGGCRTASVVNRVCLCHNAALSPPG